MIPPHRSTTRPIVRFVLIVIICLGSASLALASGGHGGEGNGGPTPIPLNDMAEAIVNFLIFAGLLYFLGRKPLARFFHSRSHTIAAELEEAARLRKEAEEQLAEYTVKLEGFERERQAILQTFRGDAEREKAVIIEEAKREAEKIRVDAQAIVRFETERARRDLRNRVVDEAVELARQTLHQEITPKTDQRLVDAFTTELAELAKEDHPPSQRG